MDGHSSTGHSTGLVWSLPDDLETKTDDDALLIIG